MISRKLNYGNHLIDKFLYRLGDYYSVLDIGAGQCKDLMLARKNNTNASLNAIEIWTENVNELVELGVEVFPINIERNIFSFLHESMDIIIANQILEHTKFLDFS